VKITNKCQIGSTVFNAGVDYETVIARAEREYRYKNRCVECNVMEDLKRIPSGDLMCSDCAENLD